MLVIKSLLIIISDASAIFMREMCNKWIRSRQAALKKAAANNKQKA